MIESTSEDQLTLVRFSASLDYVNLDKGRVLKRLFYPNRFCSYLQDRFKYIPVFVDRSDWFPANTLLSRMKILTMPTLSCETEKQEVLLPRTLI